MHRLPGVAVAGRAVARARLADRRADQGAAGGVMTAGAGVMRVSRGTHQCVGVAVGTAGRTDGDQAAVVECGGRMQRTPFATVAGRTAAAIGEVGAYRRADQAAVSIVTAGAGVVGVRRGADQGVVVAACTVGRTDADQCGMVDGRCMLSTPAAGMAGGAVAAAARDTGLQGRGRRMTVGARPKMDHCNRSIGGHTRIVTGLASGCTEGHIAQSAMVFIAVNGQQLV